MNVGLKGQKFVFLRMDYTPCPEGEKPARFGFECPRAGGPRMCEGLVLRHGPHVAEGIAQPINRTWEWNGDRERPTFRPSINCMHGDKTCWHGFITNGELTNA